MDHGPAGEDQEADPYADHVADVEDTWDEFDTAAEEESKVQHSEALAEPRRASPKVLRVFPPLPSDPGDKGR